jgi:hypothetical protein
MRNGAVVKSIKTSIGLMNRRLRETDSQPSNADRALWGALAIAQMNGGVGSGQGSAVDAEIVLSDLLADLMHWCDLQATARRRKPPIEFESALEQARQYYREERDREMPLHATIAPTPLRP